MYKALIYVSRGFGREVELVTWLIDNQRCRAPVDRDEDITAAGILLRFSLKAPVIGVARRAAGRDRYRPGNGLAGRDVKPAANPPPIGDIFAPPADPDEFVALIPEPERAICGTVDPRGDPRRRTCLDLDGRALDDDRVGPGRPRWSRLDDMLARFGVVILKSPAVDPADVLAVDQDVDRERPRPRIEILPPQRFAFRRGDGDRRALLLGLSSCCCCRPYAE